MTTASKTFHGSCHCKAVTFEVTLDLSQGISRCNCTFCYKTAFRLVFADAKDFKLLSGESFLQNYPPPGTPGDKDLYFCRQCGVRGFSRCNFPMGDFAPGFYAINVNALDDIDPAEIIAAPRRYGDGRNDNWGVQPAEIRHIW